MSKLITIEYYAIFREQRGLVREDRRTDARTASELYAELKAQFGFTLAISNVRVAVGDEFRDWETNLSQGDKVVFIPPVAGG